MFSQVKHRHVITGPFSNRNPLTPAPLPQGGEGRVDPNLPFTETIRGWRKRPAVFWRDVCDPVCLTVQPTPHPPAGRSGLFALNVHNPSAGEGPSCVPMKCIGIAGHPLPKGEGEELAPGERGEFFGSYPSAKLSGDSSI